MANSKYEYVKCFEVEDEVMFPNIILVWIKASKLHKPHDLNALKLMNSCAVKVLEEYADVVLAYGFSDEYTFVFKKTSKFYERRASKVLSIFTSFFSSIFVRKWDEFFPYKELQCSPSFHGRVIARASVEALQVYLLWRQNICHLTNLHEQCLWRLVERGMNGKEAWDFIKDFDKKINNVTPEYVRSFEFDSKLMPSTWIVVRIDGCHFHRFSEIHEFVKPNDDRALNLMNLCAVAVLEKFWEDIVFAYGVSDEYSFILKKATNLYQRRANTIISAIVSFFTSTYVRRWKNFFQQSELKYPPSFDGRALVASGKSKREAQNSLKGAQLQKKIEELAIDYNNLPVMYRQGSSVYRDKVDIALIHQENGEFPENYGKVIVGHIDIIGPTFWLEHPNILD
ncbi:Putative tRNA(His) guanylyltransferase [Glycine soja]|uniref:Putative tRNA(His) guanylyltransferase n=1 Tax=Glycine soja TaxID=3848 RepID=A0A0B2PJL9_GLYSO|nr:Putative tRNA(His) guanylyltransferase [Glycine soja]